MTGQIVIESSPPATNRRQPLLDGTLTPSQQTPPKKRKSNAKEVAGVTTANCIIVCCCCPCVVVEFLILIVYKVPVNLCRRIWKNRCKKMRKKKNKKNKRLLELHGAGAAKEMQSGGGDVYYKTCYFDELKKFDHQNVMEIIKVVSSVDDDDDNDNDGVDWDNKMWDQFQSTGFWRSSSQRHS